MISLIHGICFRICFSSLFVSLRFTSSQPGVKAAFHLPGSRSQVNAVLPAVQGQALRVPSFFFCPPLSLRSKKKVTGSLDTAVITSLLCAPGSLHKKSFVGGHQRVLVFTLFFLFSPSAFSLRTLCRCAGEVAAARHIGTVRRLTAPGPPPRPLPPAAWLHLSKFEVMVPPSARCQGVRGC